MSLALNISEPFFPRENVDTRFAEQVFANAIAKKWGCGLVKMQPHYAVDYAVIKDNKVVAWLELKNRKGNWLKYPTYMLGLKKWLNCLSLAKAKFVKLPLILAVKADDGSFYLNITALPETTNLDIKIGGTVKRGFQQDIEPCVYIPKKLFRKINGI